MIICESEFRQPDPKNPKYAMREIDYYSHLPYDADFPQHRLSLRKNLETGEYEIYRRYSKTRLVSRKALTMITQDDMGTEEVAFSGTLQEAIDFATKETDKFWVKVFGEERQKDRVCQHTPPVKATFCKVWENTPYEERMKAYEEMQRRMRVPIPDLCINLIRKHLDAGIPEITSWHEFAESREQGFVDEVVPHHRLLRAMAYGKDRGWLKAEWAGVGHTPYAGSAQRMRIYKITDYAKEHIDSLMRGRRLR